MPRAPHQLQPHRQCQVRKLGLCGPDTWETGGVRAAQTPEGPGHSSHPQPTLPRPAPRPVLFLVWAPNQHPVSPRPCLCRRPPEAPSPQVTNPGSLTTIPGLSPWHPAQHWARLSLPAPGLTSPEIPPPTTTCQNHLSFKAQCKGHLLQVASQIVPSPAACSCIAWTPVIPVTQPTLPLAMSAVSVSLPGPGAHHPLGHLSPHVNQHRVRGAGWEGGASPLTLEPSPLPAQPGHLSPAPPRCRR